MSEPRFQPLEETSDAGVLAVCACVALALELGALTAAGIYDRSHFHEVPPANPENFLEAQMVELPKEAHLTEEKPIQKPARHETVLSKVPNKGRAAKPEEKIEEQNKTDAGGAPPLPPSHGPVAVFSPTPSIPEYLKDQNLKVSVVIDFLVSALGQVIPRLVGSSGNEELDVLALDAARKWQFRPAEQDHKAIDSKVRLRILFDVH